jgi:hypothetical protein
MNLICEEVIKIASFYVTVQRSDLVLLMHAEPDTGTVRIRPAQKGFGSEIRSDPGLFQNRPTGTGTVHFLNYPV